MSELVYLDYNATAPVRPAVLAAVVEAMERVGNASSVHRAGRDAKQRLERAREQVAALVGVCASEVTFTSGGTEANVLALRGCGRKRILASAIEHDSLLGAADGIEVIPVDRDGVADLDALAQMLGEDAQDTIVSVMLANNETGVVQPIAEIAEIAHRAGALVHCDAIQAAGKIPVAMVELGVDLLSLSAHKLGGPQGVGALVAAHEGIAIDPVQRGGGQERKRRAGTENLPGIVGFGVAAEEALGGLDQALRLGALRDRIEAEIDSLPGVEIFGRGAPRLPNTSCIALSGMKADVQVMSLDLARVAVSAGSACSSGKVAASHVLQAMGVGPDLAGCAIRVSLGWNSRDEDVTKFLAAWRRMADRVKSTNAAAA